MKQSGIAHLRLGFAKSRCALRGEPEQKPEPAAIAIYHASTKPISRSAGRSAVAAAAYRSGSELVDERTGLVHDYTRKGGVESTEIMLPGGGSAERNQLWNAAEAAESRKDSRTAREWVIALPAELDAGQRRELAREFGAALVERYGVAVDVAIHAPDREGDNRNHHAHVLTTTRQVSRDGETVRMGDKATIELSDKKRRELGLCPAADEVKAVRELWEQTANRALEQAGRAERIDSRSLEAQGIDREATQHLGPVASDMERRGRASDRGDGNRQAQANNTERQRLRAQVIDLQAERERQAVKRLESMPLAELRQHVAATRSPGVQAIMQAMPEAQALEQRALAAQKAAQTAAREIEKHQRGYAEWRKGAPVRAWLHQKGIWKDAQASKVDAWLAKQEQIKATASKDLEQAKAEAPELAKRLRPLAEQQHAKMEADHARAAPILAQREQAAQEAQKQRRFELMKEQAEQQAARQMAERVMEAADLHRRGKLKDVPPHLAQVLEASQKSANTRLEREMKLRQTFTDPKMREGVAQMLKPYAKQIENGLDRGLSR